MQGCLETSASFGAERLAFLPPDQHLGNHFFDGHLGAVELQSILGGLEGAVRDSCRARRGLQGLPKGGILAEIPLEINCL
jgi:hypothetical protein